jgi:hypothetical protein
MHKSVNKAADSKNIILNLRSLKPKEDRKQGNIWHPLTTPQFTHFHCQDLHTVIHLIFVPCVVRLNEVNLTDTY